MEGWNLSCSTVSIQYELHLMLWTLSHLRDKVLGSWAWLISLSVALSTFGSSNGTFFSGGRMCYIAAREGHMVSTKKGVWPALSSFTFLWHWSREENTVYVQLAEWTALQVFCSWLKDFNPHLFQMWGLCCLWAFFFSQLLSKRHIFTSSLNFKNSFGINHSNIAALEHQAQAVGWSSQ